MPVVGVFFGGASFDHLAVTLGTKTNEKGEAVANLLRYGNFIQTVVDFLILAFVIFLIVKAANKFRAQTPPAGPTPSEALLAEIRDLLKK